MLFICVLKCVMNGMKMRQDDQLCATGDAMMMMMRICKYNQIILKNSLANKEQIRFRVQRVSSLHGGRAGVDCRQEMSRTEAVWPEDRVMVRNDRNGYGGSRLVGLNSPPEQVEEVPLKSSLLEQRRWKENSVTTTQTKPS